MSLRTVCSLAAFWAAHCEPLLRLLAEEVVGGDAVDDAGRERDGDGDRDEVDDDDGFDADGPVGDYAYGLGQDEEEADEVADEI